MFWVYLISGILKPNAQRKTELNWTQLGCSVQFSFPLWIEPATIRDDSATKLAVVAGSSQSGHILVNRPINAVSVVGRKPATSCDDWRRPSQVLHCQEPATAVVGRHSSSPVQCTAENWTELNWTKLNDPVELSWVQFSAVHWALVTTALSTMSQIFPRPCSWDYWTRDSRSRQRITIIWRVRRS